MSAWQRRFDTGAPGSIASELNPKAEATSREAKHVTEVARKSLDIGIAQVRENARIGDIGAAIEAYATSEGCSVVRDFVGHGIGRKFHTDPQVPHYKMKDPGVRMKAGMIFT